MASARRCAAGCWPEATESTTITCGFARRSTGTTPTSRTTSTRSTPSARSPGWWSPGSGWTRGTRAASPQLPPRSAARRREAQHQKGEPGGSARGGPVSARPARACLGADARRGDAGRPGERLGGERHRAHREGAHSRPGPHAARRRAERRSPHRRGGGRGLAPARAGRRAVRRRGPARRGRPGGAAAVPPLMRGGGGGAKRPIRILVAKPGLDGHDRGAKVVAAALRDAGMEVIYTGLHQTPEMIAQAAIQEDVDVVGLSILSGAHLTLFPRVKQLLARAGRDDILVTGGGIIPPEDMQALERQGIGKLFGPGTPTSDLVKYIADWATDHASP